MTGSKYDNFGGEVVALLEVLRFADANRWGQVVFESDSSTLLQALTSSGSGDLCYCF